MMARMRMLMVSEVVAVAKLMLVGCFSPDLAINIPWKALKLCFGCPCTEAPNVNVQVLLLL